MSKQIEQIRAEMERLIKNPRLDKEYNPAYKAGLRDLLQFIDARLAQPVPSDVQEAADWYIGHRAEVGEDSETFAKRKAFADGMLAERWRVNRKAEVPEDYEPEYDKEALEAANEYVKGKQILTYGAFRLMRPAFADGWMEYKERMMKEAVECEIGWSDGYRIAPANETSMNEALAKIGILDQVGAGVEAKVLVIIVKEAGK